MFTGIIQHILRVSSVADGPRFRRLTLACEFDDVRIGESICINGACLTVSEISPGQIGFDVIKETLDKTNLGMLAGGDSVNIERSLQVGQRIDGHFVQGHVDGTGVFLEQLADDKEWRFRIKAPEALAKFLTPKGSITIDGVALTIAQVNGPDFDVALIPTTLKLTTLSSRAPGWHFNLEADILAKTVVHFLEQRGL